MPQQWKDQFHVLATPQSEELLIIKQESHPGSHCLGKSVPLRTWCFIPMQVFDQLKKILTIKTPNHWILCAFPVHAVVYSKLEISDQRNCSHWNLTYCTAQLLFHMCRNWFILFLPWTKFESSCPISYIKLLLRYYLILCRGHM